jgi:hypothetical protein
VTTEVRDLFRRPLLPSELSAFDAMVIDPPRAGAEAQTRAIAEAQVPRIAAVSCNPVTFARDAAILTGAGYRLNWVQPVDQFRWSTHVELAASLTPRPYRRVKRGMLHVRHNRPGRGFAQRLAAMAGQCPGPQHDHRRDRVQRDHPRDGDIGHADGGRGPLILALDRACLAIFVIEIALKLLALGGRFFRSGWNLFDFVIVGIALVPGGRGCRSCGRCASSGSCASCRWSRRCGAWWRG